MKVVLFCGGLGTRLRDYSDAIPKPMVTIGHRPILWHVMKYYAYFGHKEFVLCLGYKGEAIKDYFLNYNEWVSNDFVLSQGGREVRLLNSDIDDWEITFVDTGVTTSIGQRLKAVEPHLDGDEFFLANYSDGLTDLWFPTYLDHALDQGKVASFLAVHSTQAFHIVSIADGGLVTSVESLDKSNIWINGGFFVFRKEIFSHIREGEDLVFEPFERLMKVQELVAYKYEGFWTAMDTFKDRQALQARYELDDAPWELWKTNPDINPPGVG